jgi:hypothetical protein
MVAKVAWQADGLVGALIHDIEHWDPLGMPSGSQWLVKRSASQLLWSIA